MNGRCECGRWIHAGYNEVPDEQCDHCGLQQYLDAHKPKTNAYDDEEQEEAEENNDE